VTILIVQDEGSFVAAVGETTEVEEISCLAQVDDRQTQLVIEAEGDPDEVADSDITTRTLEETLQETLLDLFARFCDPEVHNVIGVQFKGFGPARSRKLQTECFNSTSNNFTSGPFTSTSNNSTSRPFFSPSPSFSAAEGVHLMLVSLETMPLVGCCLQMITLEEEALVVFKATATRASAMLTSWQLVPQPKPNSKVSFKIPCKMQMLQPMILLLLQ
jgi:hypothetical protein